MRSITKPDAAADRRAVLIVDDQPTVRTVLTHALSGSDALDVVTAENGIEALAHLHGYYVTDAPPSANPWRLDLLVLDIMMPRIAGLEVIEAMRWTYGSMPRTMVISALDDEVHVADALRLGAIDYLPKPIDTSMFLHRVETLCTMTTPPRFRWVPLARFPTVRIGHCDAQAKAISEAGIIVQAGDDSSPSEVGEVVELASPVFDDCRIDRRVRGRVVRITTLGRRRTVELSFVGLHERDLCGIRRYCARR
jgi:DNA-binding response OmpR family regulator